MKFVNSLILSLRSGRQLPLLLISNLLLLPVFAQPLATMSVGTSGKESFVVPVQVSLDGITDAPANQLQLIEKRKERHIETFFQIEVKEEGRVLHWLVEPSSLTERFFELTLRKSSSQQPAMQLEEKNGTLLVTEGKQLFLQYNFGTVYPPAGIDTAFKRSGFIHPLHTPAGQSLTRIHAPDHYHHLGLWNPWTRVLFEKDTVDFWNLKDKKGTVRFAGFASQEEGNVYAGFTVLHEHIVFKKDGTEKTAIQEKQAIRIYRSALTPYYILDITSVLACAGETAVKLLEYRYGGMSIRATEEWNKENSIILTSEGKERSAADGSTARWCLAQGNLGSGDGGLVMMSSPINYNHPEPLRVWPENMHGRGDVFLNFSPTKNKDWLLVPGNDYILRYRFLVFDDKITQLQAEEAWQSFARPLPVKITKL